MLYYILAAASVYLVWKYSNPAVEDYRQEHPQFSRTEKTDSDDLLNPVSFQGHPPPPDPNQIRTNPYN